MSRPHAAAAASALTARRGAPEASRYPEVPKILVAIFLGFLVFRYLEGGQRIELLGRIRFELIVGLVLSAVGVAMFMRDKTRPPTTPLRWGLALAAWMLVMVPLSVDPALSWNVFFERVVKFLMLTIFIAAFVTTPQVLRWFFVAYLLAFAKMAQEGIHGLITGSLVWENQGVMRLHGPTWSYAHPNSFSGTQLGTVPYLYELARLAPRWLRLAMIGQAVCALVIVLYCGSRTAYLGFFAWIALLILRARSSFKALAALVLVIGLAIPFIPAQYLARFETIYTQEEIEGASIDTRKVILNDAWNMFLERPGGVGVGAFPTMRDRMFGRQQDTHNLYLEVATNLGFIGFVLFLGFVISMLKMLARLRKALMTQLEDLERIRAEAVGEPDSEAGRHRFDLRVMLAAAQATSAFLIIRLMLGVFGHDLYEVYWWFILGVVVALNRMQAAALARTDALIEPKAAEHALAR